MSKRRWKFDWSWLPGLLVAVSLAATGLTFARMIERERDLTSRFEDSGFWMGAKFSYEIETLVAALAMFDGSQRQIDDIRTRLDIALGRMNLMENSSLIPPVEDGNRRQLIADEQQLQSLEQPIGALTPADGAAARRMAEQARSVAADVSRISASLMQGDVKYRENLGIAVSRSQHVFLVSALVLLLSFGLMLRTLVRQAQVLTRARSDLRRALDRAEAGARAKAAFLATMSHEIRTPMNGVLCAASLLAQTALDSAQRRSVEIVTLCGEALMGLLDDVLDFSALEAERIDLHPEPCNLRQVAEKSCRVIEVAAAQKGIDLALAVDADVPDYVVTDGRRLGQVMINLISNGVKFTASGGVVLRLSVRRAAGGLSLRLAVIDSGPGVSFADRTRIFEEFTRADSRSTRDVRGSGLGLAISRRIVAKMRGTLRVTGVAGRGSIFMLRVPVMPMPLMPAPAGPQAALPRKVAVMGGMRAVRRAVEQNLRAAGHSVVSPHGHPDVLFAHASVAAATLPDAGCTVRFGAAAAGTPEHLTGLSGLLTQEALAAAMPGQPAPHPAASVAMPMPAQVPLRLLIADDDPINREMEAELLRHLGHHVTVAADGMEALGKLRTGQFDGALLDRHMPGLDGEDIARAVRQMDTPVRLVAVTADADLAARALLIDAGFDAVLAKPVTLERLARVLADVPANPSLAWTLPDQSGMADIVDSRLRAEMNTRLTPERVVVMLTIFWEQLPRALTTIETARGLAADRQLHALAGSAATLGYADVARAARRCRSVTGGSAEWHAVLAGLHAALSLALRWDVALLDNTVTRRCAEALDGEAADWPSAALS